MLLLLYNEMCGTMIFDVLLIRPGIWLPLWVIYLSQFGSQIRESSSCSGLYPLASYSSRLRVRTVLHCTVPASAALHSGTI